MIETLLSPFGFEFMQQAFVAAVLVAVPTALLSCFLVLKGWSLMGDAISHAVLPGIVGAYLLGLPLALGAFAAGLGCALLTGFLKDNSRIKQDTAMGVVFSGMFGLGLVMFVKARSELHLDHILFGDILGIAWSDVAETGAIAALVTVAVALRWRDLMLFSFDPAQARALGLRVGLLHYGLLALLALTIVGALKAVGIILAIATLIAPGATAFLLTKRLSRMLPLAVALSVGAACLGLYLSFFIDSAPAPTIVLVMSALFVLALLRTGRRSDTEPAAA